jgi:hypothetical protein
VRLLADGTLTAYWQTTTMTKTAVAAQIHQALDFHVDFAAQITFGGELRHFATQLFNLLVAQILDPCGWVDPSVCTDFLCSSATNTIDVGQRDNSVLVIWIDSYLRPGSQEIGREIISL